MRSPTFTLLVLAILTGCTQYEYQEDLYLEVDGSGEIWLSGSKDLIGLLYGIDGNADDTVLKELFESPSLQVVSVKRSQRRGRSFFNIRARFEDLTLLSDHPAFPGRRYRLGRGDRFVELAADIPGTRLMEAPPRIDGGPMRFRIHFPSPVHHHNSDTGVERGNIITWEQPIAKHLEGEPLHMVARFDRRTVLAATLMILAVAIGLAVLIIVISLYVLVRIGRRELAAESDR
jgi:hypothetical protein